MAHGKGVYMARKPADADCHMIASIGGPLSTQVHILGVDIHTLWDTGSCGNFIKSSQSTSSTCTWLCANFHNPSKSELPMV